MNFGMEVCQKPEKKNNKTNNKPIPFMYTGQLKTGNQIRSSLFVVLPSTNRQIYQRTILNVISTKTETVPFLHFNA